MANETKGPVKPQHEVYDEASAEAAYKEKIAQIRSNGLSKIAKAGSVYQNLVNKPDDWDDANGKFDRNVATFSGLYGDDYKVNTLDELVNSPYYQRVDGSPLESGDIAVQYNEDLFGLYKPIPKSAFLYKSEGGGKDGTLPYYITSETGDVKTYRKPEGKGNVEYYRLKGDVDSYKEAEKKRIEEANRLIDERIALGEERLAERARFDKEAPMPKPKVSTVDVKKTYIPEDIDTAKWLSKFTHK